MAPIVVAVVILLEHLGRNLYSAGQSMRRSHQRRCIELRGSPCNLLGHASPIAPIGQQHHSIAQTPPTQFHDILGIGIACARLWPPHRYDRWDFLALIACEFFTARSRWRKNLPRVV